MLSISRYSIQNSSLAPWIKFIWYLEAEKADIHLKLLPTDSIDIIMNLSDEMIYETESRKIAARSFHVNGLRGGHSYIHQSGEIRVFGISFYSYGLFPFINKSLKNVQNDIVDLYSISVPLAQKLKSATSKGTIQDIVESIEKVLCSEMNVNDGPISKAIIIRNFIETDEDTSIRCFCAEQGVNVKTFERTVLRYTGYTPKVLRRIKRFQTASNQLIRETPADLAAIAYDNSFTDQSHFTKEFCKFSGATPRAFQQERIASKKMFDNPVTERFVKFVLR